MLLYHNGIELEIKNRKIPGNPQKNIWRFNTLVNNTWAKEEFSREI